MIYVKGVELTREGDNVVVGVSEEEFSKSLLYYAVSTVEASNLQNVLKELLSGNGLNLSVSVGSEKSGCSCGGSCGCEKKTNEVEIEIEKEVEIKEEVKPEVEVKIEEPLSIFQEDAHQDEVVNKTPEVDLDMMRNSLIEIGELKISVEELLDNYPTLYGIITSSNNQFNKNLLAGCDVKLQININNVTYAFVKNGKEIISPTNNVVFYWDVVDVNAVEEMFNLIEVLYGGI